ncbi:hypothetical protein HELRODRAFT_69984 [Helobdella robusta]|uniref:Armadillo repeat-containing domain-containing protein n=1 Tax=Helobdella robusta TaxID=6412 RepID=T1G011_HELRO|nr:hypothetical protein HELRODRAFT_69984 [Helobdella robusta]ESN91305.1 hypothetical protein HELRODRAFT_69984 [Helobdella robusta]
MFATREYLEKKTGPNGLGRLSHLQSIVDEFQQTTNNSAKLQILANLANFAYDPINLHYLKVLNVVELFLADCLLEDDDQMVLFSIGGLCNLVTGYKFKYITYLFT